MQTNDTLSKFERAKILGIRAEQIAFGGKPAIEVPTDVSDPLEIAKLELQQGRTPLIIRRTMPDGSTVDIKVSALFSREN